MTRAPCPFCGGMAIVGSTCPKAIPCPTCYAAAGSGCRRPSGHACDVHQARYEHAEHRDAMTLDHASASLTRGHDAHDATPRMHDGHW